VSVDLEAPRLPIVLRPVAGENIHGFLRRLAEANGHRVMRTFAQALGLGDGFGPASAGRAWELLAQAVGLTSAEVGAMRWNRTGQARLEAMITVSGTQTAKSFAYPRNTRLCLACLRQTRIERDFWSFSSVIACPHHGTLLVTTCGCGRPLLPGVYGRTWECVCGAVPSDLGEIAAPTSAAKVARNLAARVGPISGYTCENDLKAPFDTTCAHDYMVLVHTLGVAAATPASEDTIVLQATGSYRLGAVEVMPPLDVALARLQAATRIIDDWPDALVALLRGVEGRNAAANASTIAGAFATSIGKMLVSPMRGADGLPLRVLHQAVDRYWDEHHAGKRRRKRNLSTSNLTAKRIHVQFNVTSLARAVGALRPTAFLGRILRRILEGLSDEDRTLGDGDLARVVCERAVALHRVAASSLSSEAARNMVEGTSGEGVLSGWEHPRLMPAYPALHGLRFRGQPAYAPEVVAAVLARLRAAARRIERPDGLSSLTFDGLRRRLQPWYNKTDVLLDVLEGRLAAYTVVDEPKLKDLLVNIGDLRRQCAARSLTSRLLDEDFASYKRINIVLEVRFGPDAQMTLNEFRRLARGGLVASRVKSTAIAGRQRPVTAWRYKVEDVAAFVERRLSVGGLPVAEAAAFGRTDDVGPLLAEMKRLGLTVAYIQGELANRGIRTENGAPWSRASIRLAIRRLEKGDTVLGLLTGSAFTSQHGLLIGLEQEFLERTTRGLGCLRPYSRAAKSMTGAYSTEVRGRVLAAVEAGETPTAAAHRFAVACTTVYSWMAVARDEGRREPKRAGGLGRARYITGEIETALLRILKQNNGLTLAQYSDRLAEETGVRIQPSTIGLALRRASSTKKSRTSDATEPDRNDSKAERDAWRAEADRRTFPGVRRVR